VRGGDPQNVPLYVDGRNNNLGVSNTEGIDFVASWVTDTDNAGTFTVDASGTYMTRFTSAVSPAGVEVDRLNTIFFPLKFKARGSVTWDRSEEHTSELQSRENLVCRLL